MYFNGETMGEKNKKEENKGGKFQNNKKEKALENYFSFILENKPSKWKTKKGF